MLDLIDVNDVLDLPWQEIVPAAPPAETECYFADNLLELRQILVYPLLPRACQLFHFQENGRTVYALAPRSSLAAVS